MADFNQGQYDLGADPLAGGGTYGEGKISDALQRLRGLQGALQSGQIDYGTYQKLFNQFDPQAQQAVGAITGGGSKAASAGNAAGAGQFTQLSQEGGTDLNTFAKQFQNLTGQAPTTDQINDYFTNVAPQLAGTNTADQNSLINNFLSTQYQPQIQGYQKQQQTSALNDAQTQAQNLIQQQNQSAITNLTDPSNMQKIEGAFNQNGLLNSGAFSQGLADQLSQAANSNISNAIGGITIPGIQGIENTANAPYEQFMNGLQPGLQQAGQNQQSGINFGLQSSLAQQLAQLQQPNTLQQLAPILQGAAQGGAQGGAAATSYICLELIDRGFATLWDLHLLHYKTMPAVFKKARAFYVYAMNGRQLVEAANKKGVDWKLWLKRFLTDPMLEETSVKAVNCYALAFKDLCMEFAPDLWDERVMREGFLDSLQFIPKLLFYRPYLKALMKITNMKMRFILDMPPMVR